MFEQLVHLTQQPSFNKRVLEKWAATAPEQALDTLIDDYSLFVARSFLDGALDFWTADDALNQVMVALEFEAPKIFWEVYTTFEDYEVSDNPDGEAIEKIREMVTKQAV